MEAPLKSLAFVRCERKSANKIYLFKYVSIEAVADDIDLDALEYIPSRESLKCFWCKWMDAPADTSRQRVALAW